MDFDGVLSYGRFWSSLPRNQYDMVSNFLFVENKEIVKDWMRGKYTSEEIHNFICQHLDLDYQATFELFQDDCANFEIDDQLLNELEKLKQKYYLVLRTDNMDGFDRFTLPAHPRLEMIFDEIHNSYNLKTLKLEGNFYGDFVKNTGLENTNFSLIDDSSSVCEHFKSIGGQVFKVSGNDNVLRVLKSL